jgi:hypothetical protein
MEHQLVCGGYSGTDLKNGLCNFPNALCNYAGLFNNALPSLRGTEYGLKINSCPGDQRALYLHRNRNFMSLFREIRIVGYEECSVI